MLSRLFQATVPALKKSNMSNNSIKSNKLAIPSRNYQSSANSTFDAVKYLKSNHYTSLSTVDQNSLKNCLFTPVGIHAVNQGYITITKFLTCNIRVRETINRLLNPTYATNLDDQKATIDHIFQKGYITLENLTELVPIQREMLVCLLTNKTGLRLLDDGALTTENYLGELNTDEQAALLKNINTSDVHLDSSYDELLEQLKSKFSSSAPSL